MQTRMPPAYMERISINPAVMVGKPCIRGTRVPVNAVVRMVGQGISFDEILAAYPHIAVDDIDAALGFARHFSAGGSNEHQHHD